MNVNHALDKSPCNTWGTSLRRASLGDEPSTLTNIYEAEVNIAIWQRSLSDDLSKLTARFVAAKPSFQTSITLAPQNAASVISNELKFEGSELLSENIAELIDMFCFLFALKRTGLRLSVIDRAMCPRFHVDHVPCRLVSTYQGVATDWLAHSDVNREKLGRGSNGQSDSESGLYQSESQIKKLHAGDVALLKGERWEGNEGAGLVHRSPSVSAQQRLLLTLDFS